ncbi:hypothetical protein F511_36029 [Dorcoceras hygrometricum]|uniref:Uncharacterized protein n=1 Tax=Dorcoceras hygrometricum TaxID=472368 RepID=A0A2Z7CCP4_9LAMI|nr:hypothetical protein F511_36029 [Dorcoceras hygrometricum]
MSVAVGNGVVAAARLDGKSPSSCNQRTRRLGCGSDDVIHCRGFAIRKAGGADDYRASTAAGWAGGRRVPRGKDLSVLMTNRDNDRISSENSSDDGGSEIQLSDLNSLDPPTTHIHDKRIESENSHERALDLYLFFKPLLFIRTQISRLSSIDAAVWSKAGGAEFVTPRNPNFVILSA